MLGRGRPGTDRSLSRFTSIRLPFKSKQVLQLAAKGMSLRAISKAMTRSEESMQARAKVDGLKVSKLR